MGSGHIAENLKGKKFNKWTVLYRVDNKCGKTAWHCKCECGREYDVLSCHLKSGRSKQCRVCGDTIGINKHGESNTRFYKIWAMMKARTNNKNNKYYGARDISICKRWDKYLNFKEDMFDLYKKHVEKYGELNTTIDRIDVNGNYEPSNCRWATCKEQANNTRNNLNISINGTVKTFSQWCDYYNIDCKKSKSKYYYNGKNINSLKKIFNLNMNDEVIIINREEDDD